MKEAVLEALRGGEFLSGQELSHRLGVSRTAVWKAVQALKEEGYEIEAHPHRGYRLLAVPDRLYPAEIRRGLTTEVLGRRIYYRESIASTNDEARRLAEEGAPEGTLVVAEAQPGGRGRLGRPWAAPPGKAIPASLILRPPLLPARAPQLTMVTAVAVARAVEEATGLAPGIKWPNDLLLGGRKACGILTELKAEPDRVHYVVVGIGLNVNQGAEDFPPELRETATSLLLSTGRSLRRVEVLQRLLAAQEDAYLLYLREGFRPLLSEWRRRSVTLGREVTVAAGAEVYTGIADEVDEDGALWVAGPTGRRRFLAGDVSLRSAP